MFIQKIRRTWSSYDKAIIRHSIIGKVMSNQRTFKAIKYKENLSKA